jgi:hypothetical protein
MNISPIHNSNDLKAEIFRLQKLEQEKGAALKQRVGSPGAIFSTVVAMFKSSPGASKDGGLFKQDILGVLSRFILPIALNKTLFKHSNFIIKALVGLASQKASSYISGDAVVGVWDKAKGLFTNLLNKTKKVAAPSPSYRKISKEPVVLQSNY